MDNFLKNLPALFHSFAPDGSFPGCPIDYLLEKLEVCFSIVQWPDFTLHLTCIPPDCELHQHRTLQPRLPPVLTSPLSSHVLVTMTSGIASPVAGLSIYYLAQQVILHAFQESHCATLPAVVKVGIVG